MTDTIKEKGFYEAQKYIATVEWKTIKASIDERIEALREVILEDGGIKQTLDYSRNMMRWKGIEIAKEYIEKLDCEHLKKVLDFCIVKSSQAKMLIATEVSCDVLAFSEKDWLRREIAFLSYISDFDKIYGQDVVTEDNNHTEIGLNSLESGISL